MNADKDRGLIPFILSVFICVHLRLMKFSALHAKTSCPFSFPADNVLVRPWSGKAVNSLLGYCLEMRQLSATEENKDPALPPAKPARRRGVFFWLFWAFLALLAAPVLVYLGVLAYVACGFLDRRAAQTFSVFFEAPARIASVRTEWLRNLKIEKVAIAGSDSTTPVTVDNITLDWDFGPFLADKRVRTVTIERPKIALRRSAQGQWNIHPNLAAKSAYRLEQIIMREGDLSIEVGQASSLSDRQDAGPARLHLQALSGTYSNQGPLTPKAFSLYGVLDSLESISVTGSLGPGPAWNSRVFGGIKLGRDLAGVLHPGVRGHVRYDISGWNEAPANAAQGSGVGFSSQFIIQNLHWPLSAARALDSPSRTVDLSGHAWLNPWTGSLATFDKLQLRVDGVGTLNGATAPLPCGVLLSYPGAHLDLRDMQGRIDFEALNELFQPRLWDDSLTLKGFVSFSNLTAILPFAANAPPLDLRAEFATQGLRAALRGLGELPPCELKGVVALSADRGTSPGIQAVTLRAEFQAQAATGANAPRIKIKQRFFPHGPAGPVEIEEAVCPLSALDQIFELRKNLGLKGNGTVRLRNATFDPSTGETRGTMELENVDLVASLPRGVQEAVLSVLRLTSYGFAAPLFEKSPIDTVSFAGLNLRFDAQLKDKRLALKNGRSKPFELRVELPWVDRTFVATLPAAELECELDLPPRPEGRPGEFKAKLENRTKLELAFKQPLARPGETPAGPSAPWAINGALELPAFPGLLATFSLAFDLLQRQVGPATINLKDLDLAKAQAWLQDAGIERPAGRIRNLEINLEPYSLRSLAAAKAWEAGGVFEGVTFSSPHVDAGGLTGAGHLRALSSDGSVDVNAILRVQSYGEVLCRDAFSVPPGKDGFLRLVGKYKRGEKGPEVRLELLQAELGSFKADIKGDPNRAITWTELLNKLKSAKE